ncbi:LppU/SCO3897 family protein [Plantactinospora endophytica]|uniref:Serine/threonine protein kinase n=1 Tax=Plantactinospora endophytica TaxID=673535 RepID=A0ABQ4E7U0_9ACTN|nr:hypothetical protein [Plantactinospora endophytica]GIG90779.1 hypothetical protein Pen02_57150 [Plantactinospora endophytica]
MSTYPPPGYGPGEPPHDPRQDTGYGNPPGYGAPTSGGSGYPPQSPGPYQSSPGSYPSSPGPYQSAPGSYSSSAGSYPQASEPYPQASGYPSQPGSPAGPVAPASFGEPVPPKKSKAPLIIGIVLGVVLLCCGGGTAAVLWAGDDGDPANVAGEQSPSPSPKASGKTTPPKGKPSPTPGEETIEGNLDQFKKGDCLTIDEATDEVEESSCGAKGALKVLLRKDGTIKESACESTDYTQYLYQDGTIGTLQDFILCVGPAR